MIGRLKINGDTITLEDDFTWSCHTNPNAAELVEIFMLGTNYGAPQDGAPGHAAYWKAVDELGAEATEPPVPPEAKPRIPGLVY